MNKERVISVIGLGYVGLPVAVAFGKVRRTVGFDINQARIKELQSGYDRTGEVTTGDLQAAISCLPKSWRNLLRRTSISLRCRPRWTMRISPILP